MLNLLATSKTNRKGILRRITTPFLFLAVLIGLVGGAELSAAVATEFLSVQEAELGRLLNEERVARGLPALPSSEALRTVARRHSQRMMIEGTIFHSQTLAQEVEAVFPDWAKIGENVGVGPTIPTVHDAFMESPGHRANVLDPDWGYLGIGVVTGGSRLFMTENFLTLQPGAPRPAPARFRLAGSGREATAEAVVEFGFPPDSAGGAVLADAYDFHGALAGAAMAGQLQGPIVLTGRSALHPAAKTALEHALPAGATVHLVGGPFDSSVRRGIEGLGFRVNAVGSADHAATAADVARRLPRRPSDAFLATVRTFPDALAASAVAARTGWPILYTDPGALTPATRQVLRELGIQRVHVVGGRNAVSDTVAGSVSSMGIAVDRLAGLDRYTTAAAIADFGMRNGLSSDHIVFATGTNFPDALAGGALAGPLRSPVILTDSTLLHPTAEQWLSGRRSEVDAIYLLGGVGALNTRVAQDLDDTFG